MVNRDYTPAGRPSVDVGDHRLNRALMRDAFRFATLNEYSSATGITVADLISRLSNALDLGIVGLETFGGEVFVLTAPAGRPIPAHLPEIAPNLWETLRVRYSLEEAWALWRVARSMSRAGWDVEADPQQVAGSLKHLMDPPAVGVHVRDAVVPVVVGPDPAAIGHSTGLLAEYERAGASVVCLACKNGTLDTLVTAVRRWAVSLRVNPSKLTVVLLEAPRYQPVLLSVQDAAVAPVTVSREFVLESFGSDRT